MALTNRQLRLESRPEGMFKQEDFKLTEEDVPELQEGEFLARVLYLSLDPNPAHLGADRQLPCPP